MSAAIKQVSGPISEWALLVKELGARTVVELHPRAVLAAQLAELAEGSADREMRVKLLEFEREVREAEGVPALIIDATHARLEVGLSRVAGYSFNAPGGLA